MHEKSRSNQSLCFFRGSTKCDMREGEARIDISSCESGLHA